MQAKFLNNDEYRSWSEAESMTIGVGEAVAHVGISLDDGSRLRVDVMGDSCDSCFQDTRHIGNIVYIGYGNCLSVVHLQNRTSECFLLDGYFGHLYSAAEFGVDPLLFSMLVASASELLCFSLEGLLQWRTSNLGIDGVTVESIRGDVIRGSGEWDPPGGWRVFHLSALSGLEKNV